MPARFVLFFALGTVSLMAQEQKQVPNCCEAECARLSQAQIKALVKKTKPIEAPCCADTLHINGTVVLEISVDPEGDLTCVQMVSGHSLITGVAIDSVKQWKFQPYSHTVQKELRGAFGGQVALRFRANEYAVKYKTI